MILFKIDSQRITFFPLKCDAPCAIDVNAVPFRHSLKSVEIESGNIQISQLLRLVQNLQPAQAPRLQILPHLAGTASLK